MTTRPRRQERLRVWMAQAGLILALLAVWFWASRGGLVSKLILPRPEAVAVALPQLLASANTWYHLRLTIVEILSAFAASLVAGLGLGLWAGLSAYRTRLLEPVLIALYTVPIVLLYPICILLFGLGPASKIVFAGLYGFFPIAFNTIRGLGGVDRKYVVAAQSMGASRRDLIRHVLLPGSLPVVMAGVRMGAAFNLIGVIAGEMLGSVGGLGYEIARTTQTFEVPDLYAYLIISLALAALLNIWASRTEQAGL